MTAADSSMTHREIRPRDLMGTPLIVFRQSLEKAIAMPWADERERRQESVESIGL
jgi:hypothetical protein